MTMVYFFFFNDTATTEIYTLSLHDALPISIWSRISEEMASLSRDSRDAIETSSISAPARSIVAGTQKDRKSTRLNSSHANISYAVFCLKKKKRQRNTIQELSEIPIHST